VIVKELNKASGVWNLKSQFSAQKQGTWPQFGYSVDYLVVAGGGGGGVWGGGGGAGGYRTSAYGPSPLNSGSKVFIGTGSFPITVGAGGVGSPGPYILCGGPAATNGSPSIFATITSTGGGNGTTYQANPGGSGGGDGGSPGGVGGLGNTPPTSPPQGNPGGARGGFPGYGGGGGGGAGGAGVAGNPGAAGAGGVGAPNSISGSGVSYAGGGGGGGSIPAGGSPGGGGSPCGTGGAGSGNSTGTAGTINTGGGGGSGGYAPGQAGGAGGSGIVIIRAPSSVGFAATPGTNTVATLPAPAGGCKVATFTVSGDLTIS
jgi:hypothetical protein